MLFDFGPWRPDLPDLDNVITEATNCVPATDSYEPQDSLAVYANPLHHRAQGAIALIDMAGNPYWFVGDANDLYIMNLATVSWSVVSRQTLPFIGPEGLAVGAAFGTVPMIAIGGFAAPAAIGAVSLSGTLGIAGLGVGVAFGNAPVVVPGGFAVPALPGNSTLSPVPPPYSTAPTGVWSFAQYGAHVYATNYADPIQDYSLGSGTHFNDLGGGPPLAKYIAAVKNFLVAVNTIDSDGIIPQRVRWSGIDNPNTWTVDSATQADFQDLYGDGGANQGIVAGLTQADAVILQERAVWRMTYEGLPAVFSFDMVEGVRGTPAPGSIIAVGGIVYYLGEDGFYAFDGAQSVPIGQGRVDRTFFADAEHSRLHRMSSVADVGRKLIFWSYETPEAEGNPDRILVFNWSIGEWALLKVETELLWRTLSFGYTLDDLDVFGALEEITSSFDSRAWAGGVPQLSSFDTQHRVAHFSGAPLAATLTTREMTLPNARRLLVTQTWPLLQCATASTAIRVSAGRRTHAHDTISFTPATSINAVGYCPQRVTDNFLRFRLSISSGTVWQNATGLDVVMAAPTTWR